MVTVNVFVNSNSIKNKKPKDKYDQNNCESWNFHSKHLPVQNKYYFVTLLFEIMSKTYKWGFELITNYVIRCFEKIFTY